MRPYEPGDDVRRIDWNVTARTGEPHVRVHVAERALETWLVLDTSASMTFGTADRRKWDVAEGVALALGHVAVAPRQPPRASSTFGDRDPHASPPRQGNRGLLRAPARAAAGARPRAGGPDVARRRARRARRLARRRSLVVVVSDFRGPRDWRPPLLQLAARHDVLAVEIRDPREQELPDVGDLWLVDPETGRQLRVDTRSRKLRAALRRRARRPSASELAARAALARRRARRALDLGRLAAAARRRSSQTEGRRR